MLYAKAVSNYFLQKVVDLVRNAEPHYVVQISGENKMNKRSLHTLELMARNPSSHLNSKK